MDLTAKTLLSKYGAPAEVSLMVKDNSTWRGMRLRFEKGRGNSNQADRSRREDDTEKRWVLCKRLNSKAY